MIRNETELQTTVLDLAQLFHWRRAHFRAGRMADGSWMTPFQGDAKGFPDLTLVRGKRLIFAELKGAAGKVEPEQQAWLDAFRHVAEVYIWRPNDMRDIAVILAA